MGIQFRKSVSFLGSNQKLVNIRDSKQQGVAYNRVFFRFFQRVFGRKESNEKVGYSLN